MLCMTDLLQDIEICILIFRSEACVHLYNAWIQDGFLYMQMELCPGGNLLDYLERRGKEGGVEEELVWKIFLMVGRVY